ncbi:MAG: head maturation protease, ClpP-related [Patescibacteria group bacterium]
MEYWQIKAKNEEKGEIAILGDITSTKWFDEDFTPIEMRQQLEALGDIKQLDIFINSGGGDVFAGQAIYSMLKRSKAEKTVYVEGIAASIASLIAMAGDKIIMPANSMMMIHNPYALVYGNANEMRKMADTMDKVREAMLNVYEARSNLKADKLIEMLDAETWLTAQEAMYYGMADEIQMDVQIAASINDRFINFNGIESDLSRFKRPDEAARKFISYEPPKEFQAPDSKADYYKLKKLQNERRRNP